MKSASQSKNEEHDPDWFLRDPRTRKWMVQCIGCQRVGYRADAPERFFGRKQLVAHLQPLALDSTGLCEECERAQSMTDDSSAK
jgi:hypothetical protein